MWINEKYNQDVYSIKFEDIVSHFQIYESL